MPRNIVKLFMTIILTSTIMLGITGCGGAARKSAMRASSLKAVSSPAEFTLKAVSRKSIDNLEAMEGVKQEGSSNVNKENSEEESSASTEEPSVKAETSEQPEESKDTENSKAEESSPKEETASSHQEACEHNWVAVYKTVYHDAEYDVIHHDAVYETVHHDAEYQTVHHDAVTEQERYGVIVCNTCGKESATVDENVAHQIEASGEIQIRQREDGSLYAVGIKNGQEVQVHSGYHNESRYRSVVVQEAYDEEVLVKEAWDEQVVVSEAWDEYVLKKDAWTEEVVDHYECSKCGEWE